MISADDFRSRFLEIVRQQLTWHAPVKMEDLYLIVRQASLGSGGMDDDACSSERLEREWNSGLRIRKSDRLIELIDPSGDLIRLHIRLYRKAGGNLDTVSRLCTESRAAFRKSPEKMETLLELLMSFARGHEINTRSDEIEVFIDRMRSAGFPAVSHSEEYRAANLPNYCLVLRDLWDKAFAAHIKRKRDV